MDCLIMCIGNRDGGDDGVGPYIADKLKEFENKNLLVIDCGTVPENFTGVVKKCNPKAVVIVDAADMGLRSGEIRIVPKEKIGVMQISTHGIPLSVLMDYLEQFVENVIFIGMQPENMSGEITDPVKKSAKKLVSIIKNKKLIQIEILN